MFDIIIKYQVHRLLTSLCVNWLKADSVEFSFTLE